jgi:hypothetical protein
MLDEGEGALRDGYIGVDMSDWAWDGTEISGGGRGISDIGAVRVEGASSA